MKGEVVLNEKIIAEKDGFILRLAQAQDAQPYFDQDDCPLDPEAARLTGSKTAFEKDEGMSFFLQSLDQQERVFFLIIAPDGRIIGESVINEIDWELRCANFRIGIFHPAERGRGIGAWAIERTRDFAFEQLGLHRLALDVYSFNLRAQKAYLKAGFKTEGVLRDAVRDGDRYADDILMAILEDEWKALRRMA